MCGVIDPGFDEHLAALDVFLLRAPQQRTDVVARAALVEELAEHLDTGAGRLRGGAEPDDLDLLTDLHDPALHPAGHDRAATR